MASATATYTLAGYLALLETSHDNYDLDEGELIPVPPAGAPHGFRLGKIHRYLIRILPEEQYDILIGEVGLLLRADPKPTVRGADLIVTRARGDYDEGMLREPPLLVVEVISPRNTPEDVERKRRQYLEFGIAELWIVYGKAKTIHVYQNPNGADRWQEYTIHIAEPGTSFRSLLGVTIALKEVFG